MSTAHSQRRLLTRSKTPQPAVSPHPFTARSRRACRWLVVVGLFSVLACSHRGERDRLLGYWEGTIPLPATGELVPISYDFAEEGLTVIVGLGENRTETTWPRWQVHSEDRGDIVLHIFRDDERVLSTLARHVSEGELMLWDPGTDESTAAHVRRR